MYKFQLNIGSFRLYNYLNKNQESWKFLLGYDYSKTKLKKNGSSIKSRAFQMADMLI